MIDYRMQFIRDLETILSSTFDAAQIILISNAVIKALSAYEISERCTDLVIPDDYNERILKRYRACLMINGRSEKTIYQYIRTCIKLSDLLHKNFNEIGAYDLRFFLAKELERGVSSVTLENQRANLSAFFQWMSIEDLIPKNPMAKIPPIKYHMEVKKEFSPVEIDALRSSCKSEKERALVEVLLSTGIRVSELTEMEIYDIDQNTLSVHVRHGKGDKERITYINNVAMKHLLLYLNSRKENGSRLFYNKNHDPLDPGGVRFILNQLAKRAAVINVHPHRFRRTFATGLARRGMSLQEIQRLMGHSNINTTMKYICLDESKVQASYKQFIA